MLDEEEEAAKLRSAELDTEIYKLIVKATVTDAQKQCLKKKLSEEECERLKVAKIEEHRQQNWDAVVDSARACERELLSTIACKDYKERIVKKLESNLRSE
jgi:hypothetical protein